LAVAEGIAVRPPGRSSTRLTIIDRTRAPRVICAASNRDPSERRIGYFDDAPEVFGACQSAAVVGPLPAYKAVPARVRCHACHRCCALTNQPGRRDKPQPSRREAHSPNVPRNGLRHLVISQPSRSSTGPLRLGCPPAAISRYARHSAGVG